MAQAAGIMALFIVVIRPSQPYRMVKEHLGKWASAALEVANQYNSVYVDEEDREKAN